MVRSDKDGTMAASPRASAGEMPGISASRRPLLLAGLAGGSMILLAIAMFGFSPQTRVSAATRPVPYVAEIVRDSPHDVEAWTQGLVVAEGELFESTGMEGKSSVRRLDAKTGQVLQSVPIDRRLFGEGLTALGDKLYLVTWKTGEGFVYDRKSLQVVRKFRYAGEGWGLTTDGKHLILSDGTAFLRFLDPETFKPVRRVEVRMQGRPMEKLNELEYVDGEVWANVWYEEYILRIDPRTGRVTGWIDLRDVVRDSGRESVDFVANGIAWDEAAKRLYVTGKNWPKLYEIRVREK